MRGPDLEGRPQEGPNERGAALVLVILALLVLGVLVGTAVLLSVMDRRTASGFLLSQRALAAAEEGLNRPLTNWYTSSYNQLNLSDSLSFAGSGPLDGTAFQGVVKRFGSRTFLILVEGWAAERARRRLGLLVRLRALLPDPTSALSVAGAVSVEQGATVSGLDHVPRGWGGCGQPGSSVPGVKLSAEGSIPMLDLGCPDSSCVVGAPRVELDGTGLEPYLAPAGGWGLEGLASRGAVEVVSPVVFPEPIWSNATCVTAAPGNWGDPYASGTPCDRYFPLVHAVGDLEVRGGRGQGILVVEGSLTVSGGFAYAGLVIVGGSFTMEGIGSRIEGAVVVAGAGGGRSRVEGATVIQYSSCGLQQALTGSGWPEPIRERSWIQAY